jgi:hypothetical protein
MTPRTRCRRGEEGATLILVIGFMVVVGLMVGAFTSQLASSSSSRVALESARNQQYAADAAIQQDIATVRKNMQAPIGDALTPCPDSSLVQNPGLNDVPVQVDCTFIRSVTLSGFVQRNAVFTARACPPATGAPCPTAPATITAQVNFVSENSLVDPTIIVTKTHIQSWSVKS